MLAAWEPRTVKITNGVVLIDRGDVVGSVRFFAKLWKWGHKKTVAFLRNIERDQMITKKRNGTGTGDASIVSIVKYDEFQGSSGPTGNGSENAGSAVVEHQENGTKKARTRKKTPSSSAGGDDAGCTEFWSEYTRHDAKKAAEKAWRKLNPSPELRATIMAAVAAQKQPGGVLNPTSGSKYIPYASTWLNSNRWDDQIESSAHASPAKHEPPLNWSCKTCGEYHLTPRAQKGQCQKAATSASPEAAS